MTTDQRYYAFKIPDLTNQLKECSEIDQSDKILWASRHISIYFLENVGFSEGMSPLPKR